MDEADNILEFFSGIHDLFWDPETYSQNRETLDKRFKSLVHKVSTVENSNDSAVNESHSSVTYAFFGNDLNIAKEKRSEISSKVLKVCKLLPDEILIGWRARMRIINCLDNDKSVDQIMGILAGQQHSDLEDNDFVENASTLLKTSKAELLQKHSLAKFYNAIEGLRPSKLANKSIKHRQAYERFAPFKIGSKSLKYCSVCAEQDFSTLGYSYWRCSHQIPGVLWCSHHDNLLSTYTNVGNLNNPHQIPDHAPNLDISLLSQNQIQILKRYSRIAYEILKLPSAIDSSSASAALGKRARENNFRISKPGKKITPSTTLIKVLPEWWLKDTFPRVHWISDKYIWTVDGACSPGASRYTTSTLCLLAGLFYENPNEAIFEILKPREIIQERGFEFWGSKNIYHEYITQKGVVSRIAERLSLPHSTVGVGLLNQGLPSLGKSTASAHAALEFLNGKSLYDASRALQTPVEDVENLIRAGCSKFRFALNEICNSPSSPPLIKDIKQKQASG